MITANSRLPSDIILAMKKLNSWIGSRVMKRSGGGAIRDVGEKLLANRHSQLDWES
jgi:hypothetical protein